MRENPSQKCRLWTSSVFWYQRDTTTNYTQIQTDPRSDEKATNDKLVRDVEKKGDQWFRSGDILRKDSSSYVYFVDRIGDTFRWKSENVATTMVAEVMTLFPQLESAQVNVYGVTLPGCDGRCGMASIAMEGNQAAAKLDLDGLAKHVIKRLESYARPYFLRFVTEMDITGTFKFRKVDLRKEGFDPSILKAGESLFFLNPATGKYQPLDAAPFADINRGKYLF